LLDPRITLAGLWTALMLTYLLGDVLRIFAGDFEAGKLARGVAATQVMWLVIAVIMLIPIAMIVLTLTVDPAATRWLTLIAAVFLVVFNLASLPYKGAYDNFLIIVAVVFNAIIVWTAWNWAV